MRNLPEILEREQEAITVTFYRAMLTSDAVIPYPADSGFENVVIPEGTEGWFRPTTRTWGTFIFEPVNHLTRISVHMSKLDISDEFAQTSYVLPSYYWGREEGVTWTET